jgi:N utilization substance protein A
MVTNELRGERVDVVPFSDDPVELIQNALAPARVREVRLDDETGTATVIVSDFQLSLAIGKEGQNARLAARLTGWRIDIKSETQLAEEEAGGYGEQDWAEGEWIEDEKGELVWKPAEGGEAMSASEWTHQAEDPSEVVVVTESADGDVVVEDVVVTETPDGEVIDDLVVTESTDGEVSAEEVVAVVEDGEVVAVAEVSEEAEA